jgi:hypothetical protein
VIDGLKNAVPNQTRDTNSRSYIDGRNSKKTKHSTIKTELDKIKAKKRNRIKDPSNEKNMDPHSMTTDKRGSISFNKVKERERFR